MNPAQLSSALKKIASKLEASKSPSKELVLQDLKQVILAASKSGEEPKAAGKVGQTDEKVAAYKHAYEKCSADAAEHQEKLKACVSSHDFEGASEACGKLMSCYAEMAKNKKGNEAVHSMMAEVMKSHGSHKASVEKK